MDFPLVTVIIPVYNRENTVLRAINSVLQQTYRNIELIVVDDHSTDSTVKVIKECKDSRIHLICLANNQGANFARNRGIEKAGGEFIAFQDSDDEWMENKLEKQIGYMLETNVDASFCPYFLYQGKENQIVPKDYQNISFYKEDIAQRIKKSSIVGTPTLVVRREIFSQIGMFDEKMKRLQEYELVIRLVKKYKLGFISQPLVKAYRMEQSISADNNALLDAYIKLLERHADFIDLRFIISGFLENSSFLTNGTVNWTEFDKILQVIPESQNVGMKEKCYQIAIEYLYRQCFLIREMLKEWYIFFNKNIKNGEFAIYGAGTYGHKAFNDMKSANLIPKYFLVTELGERKEIEGVPIIPLKMHMDSDMPVIIAVSFENQSALIRNLLDKGIYRFCVYPFC